MATPQAAQSAPKQICQKCGCNELITQLRRIQVDVGWKMTQLHAVAPAQMCTKCGNLTVAVNANIGDLADLVPDPDAVANVQKTVKKQARSAKRDKAAKAKAKKAADAVFGKKKAKRSKK